MSTTKDQASGELRDGYAEVGDQRLHYVEAGEGPLVVLLHGFPEFWYGWRLQIQPLAAAGFRVVAPDMRGYGRSSRPSEIESYDIVNVGEDLVGLLDAVEVQDAVFIGHDWGASAGSALQHRCRAPAWDGRTRRRAGADRRCLAAGV